MKKILLEIDLPWNFDLDLLNDIPCLICGSEGQKIGSVIVNGIELGINRCSGDELMWLSPRPDKRFYDIMYNEHFYNSTCSEQYGYETIDDENRREEKAKLNWNDIEKESPVKLIKENFLEIGCATGEMLGEAISRGWEGKVWGNELSESASKRCIEKGYSIIKGDYSAISSDIYFEIIFADNVIEHLIDPLYFIEKMYSLLKDDGMLCLRLPNTSMSGPTLKLIDHTYHFNPKSLDCLLNKSNMEIAKVIDSGIYHGSKGKTIRNMTVFCIKRS
ncbi:methyltransferase domain-containing protein [candidate division WOR-3 bacterium]|nr:methyltransferase domain-containing protein [candidate division WOR-3 bacterium]